MVEPSETRHYLPNAGASGQNSDCKVDAVGECEVKKLDLTTEQRVIHKRQVFAKWMARDGNRERIRAYQKEHRRLWRYGIRRHEADVLIAKQKGVCCICRKVPKRWTVDHNHSTGKIRGLLCNICNAGLGGFRDSIPTLKRAILYLERKGR